MVALPWDGRSNTPPSSLREGKNSLVEQVQTSCSVQEPAERSAGTITFSMRTPVFILFNLLLIFQSIDSERVAAIKRHSVAKGCDTLSEVTPRNGLAKAGDPAGR